MNKLTKIVISVLFFSLSQQIFALGEKISEMAGDVGEMMGHLNILRAVKVGKSESAQVW